MPKPRPGSKPSSDSPTPALADGAGWEAGWRAPALIVLVGFLAYLPALSAGFIFDDDSFLTANPLIKAADGLRRFWLSGDAVDYWPVTSTTLWAEWRIWGLHAAGYHATNLVLHLGECVLLWAILRQLRVPGASCSGRSFSRSILSQDGRGIGDLDHAKEEPDGDALQFGVDLLVPASGEVALDVPLVPVRRLKAPRRFRAVGDAVVLAEPARIRPRHAQQGIGGNAAGRASGSDRLASAGRRQGLDQHPTVLFWSRGDLRRYPVCWAMGRRT